MEKFSEKITWFMPLPNGEFLKSDKSSKILQPLELFSSGRDALFRILKIENFSDSQTLWIPEYFCPSVVRTLKKFINIKFYLDYPSEKEPRFQSLTPNENDAILIVNFFGLRRAETWQGWVSSQNKKLVIIEDHSHAPFSQWALNSQADYVFASLRKSLPLVDGGYLRTRNLSPKKIFQSGGDTADFAIDMLSASALQRTTGYDEVVNKLYYSGENKLDGKHTISRISKYSFEILRQLDLVKIAKKTSDNLKIFCENFADSNACIELNRKFLNTDDPTSAFNPILKFSSMQLRDKCHNALFEIGVMPSIYWGGLGNEVSEQAHKECDTLLAIPLDFRHSTDVAKRIAQFISTCVNCE
jgi:hypothetical protein